MPHCHVDMFSVAPRCGFSASLQPDAVAYDFHVQIPMLSVLHPIAVVGCDIDCSFQAATVGAWSLARFMCGVHGLQDHQQSGYQTLHLV